MGDGTLTATTEERAAIGVLIGAPEMLRAFPDLTADYFSHPKFAAIFSAVQEAERREGVVPDPMIVMDVLRTRGLLERIGGGAALLELVEAAPTVANLAWLVDRLREATARRVLLMWSTRVDQLVRGDMDSPEVMEIANEWTAAIVQAQSLIVGDKQPLTGMWEASELASLPKATTSWVIPGLLARMERVLIVASEGAGKAVYLRQIASLAAWGRHPFNPDTPIRPIRSLVVDLENPPSLVSEENARLVNKAQALGYYRPDAAHAWLRPEGLNIVDPRDFALLDRAMEQARPDLVAIGPLYKLFRRDPKDADGSSMACAAALDKLRVKYGCAIMIEHHAPFGDFRGRPMRPFGSALWQWWPEFGHGWAQDKHDPHRLTLQRFRADRARDRDWPIALRWGRDWPWDAVFAEGVLDRITYDGGMFDEDRA